MKKKQLIFLLFFGFTLICSAQQAVIASGGTATGSGGTTNYTVGQVEFTTNTSATGSLAQGVQQPFEIQTVLGIDIPKINLSLLVYPNPTVNVLTLDFGDFDYRTATYQLFDFTGKLLSDKKIIANKTTIRMEIYPISTYLLNVIDKNNTIKTFKIIKNQ